ncbi:MAG: CoB--CoM heterodisulfide reductase iron-sulfur subunit A family protein [Deltaproteobacteria bacterium]|nr:CoB--CoM heterodisulfide reductase iron-sulfur subunit A family protein [Deltaproteobacteria bacterium]
MSNKNVLVIGGGIAGLCAALELACLDIGVELVEKEEVLGGHAGQFTCKATDKCVKCGACIVEEKIRNVVRNPKIKVHLGSHVQEVTNSGKFSLSLSVNNGSNYPCEADAIIVTSGFSPFNPEEKPYGYNSFDNVITNLDLEKMIKIHHVVKRPSDNKAPKRMAFVQCVGSRDGKLNHLWCSRVCCGSALRMARLIKSRQPDTEIVLFYIDIQSFGKDFQSFYNGAQNDVRMIRTIPGDVFEVEDDRLRMTYFDNIANESKEEIFDLIVLSIGITPGNALINLAALFNIELSNSGFVTESDKTTRPMQAGVFAAGTVLGPMSIAESVASAGKAAWDVVRYLEI